MCFGTAGLGPALEGFSDEGLELIVAEMTSADPRVSIEPVEKGLEDILNDTPFPVPEGTLQSLAVAGEVFSVNGVGALGQQQQLQQRGSGFEGEPGGVDMLDGTRGKSSSLAVSGGRKGGMTGDVGVGLGEKEEAAENGGFDVGSGSDRGGDRAGVDMDMDMDGELDKDSVGGAPEVGAMNFREQKNVSMHSYRWDGHAASNPPGGRTRCFIFVCLLFVQ